MKYTQVLAVMIAVLSVSGCASLKNSNTTAIKGGIYRTVPEYMTDIGIERKALNGLDKVVMLNLNQDNSYRVAIDAFRGRVLLTGEVPSEAAKAGVANMVGSIPQVTKVDNYLEVIDKPRSQSHTVHENYLKSKLLGKLVSKHGLKSSQYSVVVRNDVAYIMGTLPKSQKDEISDASKNTDGILDTVFLESLLVNGGQTGTYSVYNNYNSYINTYDSGIVSYGNGQYTTGSGQPTTAYPTVKNSTSSGYVSRYLGSDAP